jgi:hypothetical protein
MTSISVVNYTVHTVHIQQCSSLSIIKGINISLLYRIAQWYSAGIQAGWSGVPVSTGDGNFLLHHHVQTSSGAHPAFYPMGTRGSFSGGKTASAWSWPLTSHLVPRSRMHGAIIPLLQYKFMAWCSVIKKKKHKGKFALPLLSLIFYYRIYLDDLRKCFISGNPI